MSRKKLNDFQEISPFFTKKNSPTAEAMGEKQPEASRFLREEGDYK